MAKKTWPSKDPNDVIDYGFNWATRDLGDDVITNVTSEVVTGTVVVDQDLFDDGLVTVHWLSGGTEGETCEILLRINTLAARQLDQTVYIKIKKR
jgi:hypothetical protein